MKITRKQLRQIIKEELSLITEELKTRVQVEEPKPKGMEAYHLLQAYALVPSPSGPIEFKVVKGQVEGDNGKTKDEIQKVTDLVLGAEGAPRDNRQRPKRTGSAERSIVQNGTLTVSWEQ